MCLARARVFTHSIFSPKNYSVHIFFSGWLMSSANYAFLYPFYELNIHKLGFLVTFLFMKLLKHSYTTSHPFFTGSLELANDQLPTSVAS